MKKETEEIFKMLFLLALGLFMGVLLYSSFNEEELISHETMNDICYNFTMQDGVVGSIENGKLICEVPSFDSTQNIIIKNNGRIKE
ncbi:MAG: hypothetical protein M0R17_05950 [Candidatus Omnitrophica bacterium]|jgi:hypothetical protein|nr:hypothetical protein [Candidatus Omnitrophota bacterium]